MFGFGRKGLNKGSESQPADRAGDLEGPLLNGLQYVSFVSPPNQPGGRDVALVSRAHDPSVCFGPNNAQGRSFLVEFEEGGTGKAYLFPTFGSIWVDGEPSPRAQIPTGMIANRVPGYEAALGRLLGG